MNISNETLSRDLLSVNNIWEQAHNMCRAEIGYYCDRHSEYEKYFAIKNLQKMLYFATYLFMQNLKYFLDFLTKHA